MRGVVVVLEVVERCESKNHKGGGKCQAGVPLAGLRPIRRGQEEESRGRRSPTIDSWKMCAPVPSSGRGGRV